MRKAWKNRAARARRAFHHAYPSPAMAFQS